MKKKDYQKVKYMGELLFRKHMATMASDTVCNCGEYPTEIVHRTSKHNQVELVSRKA